MEFSTIPEATSCAATQDFVLPNNLWNTKIQYPPPVPVLSQTNPVHTTPRSILMLSTHLCLGFPTSNLYVFLFPPLLILHFSYT
jgi:hypothetical protein